MNPGNWIAFASLMVIVIAALLAWERRVTRVEGKVDRILDFFEHRMERRSSTDEERSRVAAKQAAGN